MENWLQIENRSKDRLEKKIQGLQGVHSGQIKTVNPDTEEVLITTHGGDKIYEVKHPFLSNEAWIRVMPAVGTHALIQYRSDTKQPEIVNYRNPAQRSLLNSYLQESNLAYRPLQTGEIDITSRGLATSFWGRRPVVVHRGGVIRSWLDQDQLEAGAKSPTHRRLLHQHDSTTIGDEERFGLVKRPLRSSPNYQGYPKINGAYAKEYYMHIKSVDTDPTVLIEKHEGQLFDTSGSLIKQSKTQKNLRLRHRYYTNQNNPWTWEIDEAGNSVITLPTDATDGHQLNIPEGNLTQTIGKNLKNTVGGDCTYTIEGSHQIQIQKNYLLDIQGNEELNVTGDKTITAGGTLLLDGSGGKAKLTGNTIALGTDAVELLDEISQALEALINLTLSMSTEVHSTCNLGYPSSPPANAADYTQANTLLTSIKGRLDSIKGTI